MSEEAKKSSITEGLNDKQLEAVTLDSGSALILAGAGSGKTGVLTRRIAWLISEKNVNPNEILAVTFTNKAADEMCRRIGKIVPDGIDPKRMWIGTFHGISWKIIKQHAKLLNLPDKLTIIDSDDQKSVIKKIARNLNIDMAANSINPGIILSAKEGMVAKTPKIQLILDEYNKLLKSEGMLDFADLMEMSVRLMRDHPKVRDEYRARFKYILVDEFQDTNDQQFVWLNLLKGDHAHIMAVGDDDESIYSFRGANPLNMQKFLENDEEGIKLIKLEQNYRSTSAILDLANHVISTNEDRLGKDLWTSSERGDKPGVIAFANHMQEAETIVDFIDKRIKSGEKPGSIAVIYRTNDQAGIIERKLIGKNIPHKVFGGFRFFERQEIKHALAYLRLCFNPDNDTSFTRIINVPKRGIGEVALEKIRMQASENDCSLFFQVMSTYTGEKKSDGSYVNKPDAIIDIIAQASMDAGSGTLADYVRTVLTYSGLVKSYQDSGDPDDEPRVQSLEDLVAAAAEMDKENPGVPASDLLEEFLASSSLESSNTNETDGKRSAADSVSLMTVHTAKGLEFDTVYVIGVEEGLFPHKMAEEENGTEEERRLLYVAITRARKNLSMTWCRERTVFGESAKTGPSKFIIEDIPADMVRKADFSQGVPSIVRPPAGGGNKPWFKRPGAR